MGLRLDAIKFNHDPSSASVDAFNIRKNESVFIDPPEWRRGININPEDSPAAYSLFDTRGNTLTIQASFSCEGDPVGEVDIRAIDGRLNPPCSPSMVVRLLRPLLRSSLGNVLGEVEARTINPCADETQFHTFNLKNVRIWDAGVGMHDIIWCWQYKHGTSEWIELATTTHRIYSVVRVPTKPWLQDPPGISNTQLPWVEVLKHACDWASGTQDADTAAERVAHSVNGLGTRIIHFDNCNFASSHYSNKDNFDCTAFLSRLRGEEGHGPRVNCSDCAAIVSTFANSVGCSLEQSPMEPVQGLPAFPLDQHLRIGHTDPENGAFIYHEVAWEGGCQEGDEVFDASLRVDDDDDPGVFTPLLPTNLVFGVIGQQGYRSRLVPNGSEGTCLPNPEFKTRRKLAPVSSPRTVAEALDPLKVIYAYDLWKDSDGPGTKHFFLDYFLSDFALPGWQVIRKRESGVRGQRPFIQSFWRRAQGEDEAILRIDVCEGSIWTDAREILLTFLTEFQLPGIELQNNQPKLGDVALAGSEPEPCTILFATANLALLVRNVGMNVISTEDIAAAIAERLLNPPVVNPTLNRSLIPARQFRFESAEGFIGKKIRMHEEPAPPWAPRQFYRFFSSTGEMSVQDKELFYRPLSAGLNTLEIFAVDATSARRTQRLELKVQNS